MPTKAYSNTTFSMQTPSDGSTPGMSVLMLGTQEPNSTVDNCIVNATGSHWGLKMPGNVGSVVNRTKLYGGTYRVLDMVQCRGQRFNDCTFGPGIDRNPTKSKWSISQDCDIGIKGSSFDIEFNRCSMTDILLGDHDIYDNPNIGPKVKQITLTDCVHTSGPNVPIVIRCLNAEPPTLVRTNAVLMVYYRWVVLTYFWVAGKWIDSRVGTPMQMT